MYVCFWETFALIQKGLCKQNYTWFFIVQVVLVIINHSTHCSYHHDNSTTPHISCPRWSPWAGNRTAICFLKVILVAYIYFMQKKDASVKEFAVFYYEWQSHFHWVYCNLYHLQKAAILPQRWLVMREEKAFGWSIYNFFFSLLRHYHSFS